MQVADLPHQAPLRLVTHCERSGDVAQAWAWVAANAPIVDQGVVRSGYVIEIAAQVCAAFAGAAASTQPEPEPRTGIGMLTAVREWQWGASIPVEQRIDIEVHQQAQLGSATRFRVRVSVAGHLCGHGILQVHA